MAGFVFTGGALGLLDGTIGWNVDIYARLVPTAAAALDLAADTMEGIGSAEASATAQIDTPTGPTGDDVEEHVAFFSEDQVFPSAAIAIGPCNRMVFFKYGPSDALSIPVACVDIVEVTPNGGDITIEMDALGWFYAQLHE